MAEQLGKSSKSIGFNTHTYSADELLPN